MDKQREQFEAWLADWQRGTGPLSTPGKVMARACWQAAQAAQAAPGEAVAEVRAPGRTYPSMRFMPEVAWLADDNSFAGAKLYAAPPAAPDWNAAIEAAAKVCDELSDETLFYAPEDCAIAIRALAKETK